MLPSSPTISRGVSGWPRDGPAAQARGGAPAGRRGASLVEVVITLLILGLLAALVVPRLSRATSESCPDLRENLRRLRVAIELYRQDHGRWPGRAANATEPGPHGEALFVAQLTSFSDADGATSPVRSERFRYGPYLKGAIPPVGTPPDPGASGVCMIDGPVVPRYRVAPGVGWVYNRDTGDIAANTNGRDGNGTRLDTY